MGFLAPEEMLYAPSLGPDGGGWAEAQSRDPASVLEDPQSLPVPHTETPLGAALLCLFCSFTQCSEMSYCTCVNKLFTGEGEIAPLSNPCRQPPVSWGTL